MKHTFRKHKSLPVMEKDENPKIVDFFCKEPEELSESFSAGGM